jgi:hypothetical protein
MVGERKSQTRDREASRVARRDFLPAGLGWAGLGDGMARLDVQLGLRVDDCW